MKHIEKDCQEIQSSIDTHSTQTFSTLFLTEYSSLTDYFRLSLLPTLTIGTNVTIVGMKTLLQGSSIKTREEITCVRIDALTL